jgi:hypothetical protein
VDHFQRPVGLHPVRLIQTIQSLKFNSIAEKGKNVLPSCRGSISKSGSRGCALAAPRRWLRAKFSQGNETGHHPTLHWWTYDKPAEPRRFGAFQTRAAQPGAGAKTQLRKRNGS